MEGVSCEWGVLGCVCGMGVVFVCVGDYCYLSFIALLYCGI